MTTAEQIWIAVGVLLSEMVLIGIVLIYGFREEWEDLDNDPSEAR